MIAVEARRTLVKSLPEVWAQLSNADQLAPLLDGAFGQVRITRLVEDERIEWEGELARGTVLFESSGFGTRVHLIAEPAEVLPPAPEPPPAPPAPRRGLLARLLRRRAPVASQPEPEEPPPPLPAIDPAVAEGALVSLLDELAVPRHRPFSRDAGAHQQIA